MMIKRFLTFLCAGIMLCIGSGAVMAQEPETYLAHAVQSAGAHGESLASHQAVIVSWRQGESTGSQSPASNLIALSNHFGLDRAAPFAVPDWDGGASA